MGRNHLKALYLCLYQGVRNVYLPDHHFIERPLLVIVRVEIESGGRVGLRIGVDYEYFFLEHRERGGKINGGSGLAHSALLICYSDDFTHIMQK